ncbi:type II toxin-antitoxin system RelB/DinJ family antitoxin [Enterococcus faecium]|uniref:type II toxin-antitoxin system RelB/DinJ family antitoxin n=1 Tax=Enterococcus faecium TaxID=1352 RepID=UPI0018C28F9E|nr:type II toxin-antitoxin system RelB/DinJ family antitoxin [Enterococcus faecium]MBG0419501.1 type II toxin-antitoxin system RelB/DinJ family antitoxin [Enterococcus faecium]MBK1112711.1 type II toxin-antitoxin system RelB/DinJ family antitoxin [Enterococcus faecium]
MEINVEHILDCLDQYGKGELTEEQLTKALTYDEKMFLIMHQGLLEVGNDAEEDFDVLNWLGEEESFFMVIEINESLCREAETVLEEIGVEMPDAIEVFLKQLVETKQLPIAVND